MADQLSWVGKPDSPDHPHKTFRGKVGEDDQLITVAMKPCSHFIAASSSTQSSIH
ncbi:WD repeat-containing protein 62 [Corchorus olitorius]|uniref:WD repeat-containing protein 62 n=1 Tax=Corchorus olitorius TaxID=93759 RepID=A0A1R3JIT7_9ROSI|nr:WD repeat-containing protein 62 [Corchorus olitorius]